MALSRQKRQGGLPHPCWDHGELEAWGLTAAGSSLPAYLFKGSGEFRVLFLPGS